MPMAIDERHIYALMSYDDEVGAAMTCVGVFGVERSDDTWSNHVEWIEGLLALSDGGWPERLSSVGLERPLTLDDMSDLAELGNGITWDLWEIDAEDYAKATSLSDAIEVILNEVLEATAEPRDALRAAGDARVTFGDDS